ncbi:MAG: hypothetical protein ACTS22_08625 [Phycisphaerales bacterium]
MRERLVALENNRGMSQIVTWVILGLICFGVMAAIQVNVSLDTSMWFWVTSMTAVGIGVLISSIIEFKYKFAKRAIGEQQYQLDILSAKYDLKMSIESDMPIYYAAIEKYMSNQSYDMQMIAAIGKVIVYAGSIGILLYDLANRNVLFMHAKKVRDVSLVRTDKVFVGEMEGTDHDSLPVLVGAALGGLLFGGDGAVAGAIAMHSHAASNRSRQSSPFSASVSERYLLEVELTSMQVPLLLLDFESDYARCASAASRLRTLLGFESRREVTK